MLVMDCGDPTQNISDSGLRYADGNPPNITTYMASANVSCRLGFIYTDGSFWKLVNCQANGAWTSVLDCQSIIY